MNLGDPFSGSDSGAGLLVDTNLLVLFTVGTVNRDRIENFKRTRQYSKDDYALLLRVMEKFSTLYTVATPDLYLTLGREGITVVNFTHLRARTWGM